MSWFCMIVAESNRVERYGAMATICFRNRGRTPSCVTLQILAPSEGLKPPSNWFEASDSFIKLQGQFCYGPNSAPTYWCGNIGIEPSQPQITVISRIPATWLMTSHHSRHQRQAGGVSNSLLPHCLVPKQEIESCFNPYQGLVIPIYYKGKSGESYRDRTDDNRVALYHVTATPMTHVPAYKINGYAFHQRRTRNTNLQNQRY